MADTIAITLPENKATLTNCDGSDDEESEPSVLKIMIEKQASIEQTVTLLKKEIVKQTPEIVAEVEKMKVGVTVPVRQEFDGLNNLLADNKVQSIIQNVAGIDTKNVIDNAMVSINSSQTIEAKRLAFSQGIRQLKSNLAGKLKDNKDMRNDPTLTLALSLTGINHKRIYDN